MNCTDESSGFSKLHASPTSSPCVMNPSLYRHIQSLARTPHNSLYTHLCIYGLTMFNMYEEKKKAWCLLLHAEIEASNRCGERLRRCVVEREREWDNAMLIHTHTDSQHTPQWPHVLYSHELFKAWLIQLPTFLRSGWLDRLYFSSLSISRPFGSPPPKCLVAACCI